MSNHRQANAQDLHAPSNEPIENKTGANIPVFRAVKFDGMGTNHPKVSLADGSISVPNGITQTEIINNDVTNAFYMTALGILTMVDTSSFNVNDLLYAGANGVLSTTENGEPVARVLVSDSTYGKVYVSGVQWGIESGNLAGVTASRELTNHNILTSFSDVLLDTTDLENETNIVEHNDSSVARIDIKQSGVYFISYAFSVKVENGSTSCDYNIEAQILKNGSTPVDPLFSNGASHYSGSTQFSESANISKGVAINLVAGDYITLQAKYSLDDGSSTPTSIYTDDATLSVVNLKGVKGDKGDTGTTGSGSSIIINDEGSPIANTPHTEINLIGGGVIASDGGGGRADITISSVFGSQAQLAVSEGLSITTSDTYIQKLKLTTSSLPSGAYLVSWFAEFNNDSSDRVSHVRIEQDDTTELGQARNANKQVNEDSWENFSGFKVVTLSGVHTFDIDFKRDGSDTAQIQRARIVLWRVS